MNEEFNPYDKRQMAEYQQSVRSDSIPPAPEAYADYPQPSVQPYGGYAQPAGREDPPQAQYPAVQDYSRQQLAGYGTRDYYPNQNQAYSQRNGGKAAKIFSIISFVIGCVSLFRVFLFTIESVTKDFWLKEIDLTNTDALSIMSLVVPGLVFGIIALTKKTRNFPMALLGVIFCGVAAITIFSTFFLYYSLV